MKFNLIKLLPHDRNGQALFYDSQGNTKRNRTEEVFHKVCCS